MKKVFLLLGLTVLGMGSILAPLSADAATTVVRKTGLIFETDHIDNVGIATGKAISARMVAVSVINFILFFLGLLTTAMVIYGGFIYITAAGDESKTENGKNIMTYSAIGIVIIFISFALVNTLLGIAHDESDGDPAKLGPPGQTGAAASTTTTESE